MSRYGNTTWRGDGVGGERETIQHDSDSHRNEHTDGGAPTHDSSRQHDAEANRDMSHGGMHQMASDVTTPQLTLMSIVSVLVLFAGILWSASYANLSISADDVRGAVMPPGMILTNDTPAEAMRDMAAVDPNSVSYTAPADARGDQVLIPKIENGVKVFNLDASVIKWNILPDEQVMAYAFNQQVPGPRIRITQGDRVRINVTNHLPESTTVHWHGLIVPNAMDGPANITQEPIAPGKSYSYEFEAKQYGTYFYHTHDHIDRQQALGLYGALIIDPKDPAVDAAYGANQDVLIQLQEWTEYEGHTFPAMPMDGSFPNFFTINGKSYPETQVIKAKVGDKIRVRFIGSNSVDIHPMHIHGGPFRIVAIDGEPVPPAAQIMRDTVNVGPGQRYDVIWAAREPGKWLLHCHISHHTTNNNVEEDGGGGLMVIIDVAP